VNGFGHERQTNAGITYRFVGCSEQLVREYESVSRGRSTAVWTFIETRKNNVIRSLRMQDACACAFVVGRCEKESDARSSMSFALGLRSSSLVRWWCDALGLTTRRTSCFGFVRRGCMALRKRSSSMRKDGGCRFGIGEDTEANSFVDSIDVVGDAADECEMCSLSYKCERRRRVTKIIGE